MAMHANALVVMAKPPVTGMVKTRLVPPLSPEEAAELYRCLLLDLLESLQSFKWADLFVAFTPADAASLFDKLVPSGFACFPQRGVDLGERMDHVFEDLFCKGYRNIVLVGSDLPYFPSRFLDEAFVILERSAQDLVLGPSFDGGYYLIGMNRHIREVFEGIPWSTESVLSKTVQKLTDLGLKPYLLPLWFDIDRAEDLRYLKSSANPLTDHSWNHTLKFMNRLSSLEKLS